MSHRPFLVIASLVAAAAALVLALGATVAGAATPAAPASSVAAPALAPAPFTSPDGLWTWSRPLPFGYRAVWSTPNAVAAPSPDTLFVATSEPDLLVTRDAGGSWAWSRTGAVPGLGVSPGVVFVSTSEGWAWNDDVARGALTVAHTTDAGLTWQPSLSLDVPAWGWQLARFPSPRTGWVVASPSGGVEYDSCLLYHTTDGGLSWSEPVVLPQDDFTTFQTVAAQGTGLALVETLWNAGAGNGDIVGSRILRTTDGGATWSAPAVLKGADIGDAAFTTPARGWATGDSWLWGTTDGGAHWHKVRAAPGYDRLVVTGDGIWAIPRVQAPYALHSANGGATWHEVAGMAGVRLSFASKLDGWVVRGRYATLYQHTTNGGTTWTTVVNAATSEMTALATSSTGTAWGVTGHVIRSDDAGATWRRATRRTGLTGVAAAGARDVWAVGQAGVIIHSHDAGRHWTLQASGVKADLRQVVFADARHGWVGGKNGVLLRTVDGGRHWTAKRFGAGKAIHSLTFADTQHGLAVRGVDGGEILHTSDGGRHWAVSHLPVKATPPYELYGARMQDASHAVLLSLLRRGPVAQAWSTSDGGATWQLGNTLPVADAYVSIAPVGSDLCAVGHDGAVVVSSDGGVTWSSLGSPSGMQLDAVALVGPDTLMIAGLGVLTRDMTAVPLP